MQNYGDILYSIKYHFKYHSMRQLFAKIMLIIACNVLMLHAMVPHHHMGCGVDGGFMSMAHAHYGMCKSDKDCIKVNCFAEFDVRGILINYHSGEDSDETPSTQCKIQKLLAQSLINSTEQDIYTAIVCDAVLDLLYGDTGQELLVAFIPIATCDWADYIENLPTQGIPSDAPLRAPPIC